MSLISLKNIRFLAYLERTSRGSRYSWKLNPKTHKWHYERVKTRIHLSREQKNSLYKIIIKNKKQKTRPHSNGKLYEIAPQFLKMKFQWP